MSTFYRSKRVITPRKYFIQTLLTFYWTTLTSPVLETTSPHVHKLTRTIRPTQQAGSRKTGGCSSKTTPLPHRVSRAKCTPLAAGCSYPTEYRCYWTTVYVADSRLPYRYDFESPVSNQSSETLCLSKTTTNTNQSETWYVKRVQFFFKWTPQFSICGRTVSNPPIDRRHCTSGILQLFTSIDSVTVFSLLH